MTTEPSVAEVIVLCQVDELKPSPFNRRHKKAQGLAELAASITSHGIIEPLIGRQVNGHVELVAGERRWRAAQKAGHEIVPVVIRELTDAQALEQLLEENLQRDDVHPMDEAESYEQLRDTHSYSIEDLADRFGRSKFYIRQRLQLLQLEKSVRKLYLQGKIDHRLANLISRIADPSAQKELADDAVTICKRDEGEGWDRESFRRGLKEDFMLDLASAPFDITSAELVTKAGACSSCPKRTGQQRELFAELAKKEDLCLDRTCYRAKVDSWWATVVADAEVEGVKVLSDAEAKKEINDWGDRARPRHNSPYISSDTKLSEFTGDYSSQKLVRTTLKKDPPQRVLARTEDGRVVEMFDRKEVAAKLKVAGVLSKAAATRASNGVNASQKRDRKRRQLSKMTANRAIAAAVELAETNLDAAVFLPLAKLLCSGQNATETAKSRGFKKSEELAAEILKREKAGSVPWLRGVIIELAVRDGMYYGGEVGPKVKTALEAWGIDLKAIEKEVKAELAAKEKERKAKAKKKAAAKKGKAKKKTASKKNGASS